MDGQILFLFLVILFSNPAHPTQDIQNSELFNYYVKDINFWNILPKDTCYIV